jgi:hypothetical protein
MATCVMHVYGTELVGAEQDTHTAHRSGANLSSDDMFARGRDFKTGSIRFTAPTPGAAHEVSGVADRAAARGR